ncbi:trans-aconitate 2-methyltransferase [Rhizobium sp. DKSPLA3]|uniref:Trans-aconitate 2-methyltransferase n=1 Tax=Rhizobium quercicola TaxID=2901226 RepID=A0A9X1NW33_9HYPH|nr:trans-aconitate 2-methyltransferase [Rhizobium quercicola]MCD7111001.1 trans-aconitate 2-methyltransferase [Rhizobium quercicola]
MAWSAAQYIKFEDERTRPARDLLAQVPDLPQGPLFDLGCGPANSTELVAARFAGAPLTGIDSDADMLAAARRRLPGIPFVQGDLAAWRPSDAPALLFANAVLQWMPDPATSIVRLAGMLAPGGVLAVQMPDNLTEPTHRAMREIAADPAFAEAYGTAGLPDRNSLPAPGRLVDLLSPLCARVDVWHTIYYHRLDGAEAIVEWVKGTGLRPYLAPLSDDLRQSFLARYLERIRAEYPPLADGRVLLRFPRLFLVAIRT